jgi:hypothetical protein
MSEYSPGVAMGAIKDAVDQGLSKIASLNSELAGTLAKMTSAFQSDNVKMLKEAYDLHNDRVTARQAEIDKIEERIIAAKKDQRDYEQGVKEFESQQAEDAARLEFDKLKQDDTRSYQEKQLDFDKMQLSETIRHNKKTELEAEQKRLQDAAGSSFDVGNTPFASTIVNVGNLLTARMSDTRASALTKSLATMAQQKDWSNLLVNLKNQAKVSLPAADQSKLNGHENNIAYLSNMEQLLKEYEESGGDTGLLVGTAQGIATKYGQVVTDPKLIELQTQMNENFVRFRAEITGAAFSPAESKGYEALVPSATKNIDLNLAVIQAARDYAEQQSEATYSRLMGKDGYNNLNGVVDTESKIQSWGEANPSAQPVILKMQAEGKSPAEIAQAFNIQI